MGVTENGLFDVYYSSLHTDLKKCFIYSVFREVHQDPAQGLWWPKSHYNTPYLPACLSNVFLNLNNQSTLPCQNERPFQVAFFYPKLVDIFPYISSIHFKNNKQHLSSHYTLPIMAPISFMRNQNVVSIPQQFCIHFKGLVPINSILSTVFSTFTKQGNF